jgi:cytochrome c-type biogenesis protein CcmF
LIVLGRLALACCLAFSLGAVALLGLGVRRRSADLVRSGYLAVYGLFFAVVVACAVLLEAFVGRDFAFAYVAQNSDSSLSLFYRVAGFWAGQQGSLLLWTALLALVTVVIALRDIEAADRLTAATVAVLAAVTAVFVALMVVDGGSDPFLAAAAGASGAGLNPLLLHPAMVLHPPALFAAYATLAVPFAGATATLLLGDTGGAWASGAQRWALAGWLLLSLGIGLGAWWAYVVLSWGGYWGWDPVENTSLVPWLTATALVHSLLVYRRSGQLARWTLGLACATFWATILATWTTRTDLISSVHAFERNDTMIVVLTALLGVVAALSIGLLAGRWRRFAAAAPARGDGAAGLASAGLNVGLSVLAAALAAATVLVPLTTDRTLGPAAYRTFAEPLGVAVVAALALCPLLAAAAAGRSWWRALRWPLLAAAAALPLLLASGRLRASPLGVAGLDVCCLAAAALAVHVAGNARRGAGERLTLAGLRRALLGSRSRSAALVAHLGVVLVLLGLVGSNLYRTERNAYIAARPGATAAVAGYTLRFSGFSQDTGPQGSRRFYAHFTVSRGGRALGSVAPHTDVYPAAGAALRAVILGSPSRDLFVVAQDPFDTAVTHLRLQLDVFPLMRVLWAGVALLVGGGAVALWPARRRAPALARERRDEAVREGAR